MMIRAMLALVAMLVAPAARADWYEASSPHFVVYSEDRPANLERFATRLETFDKAMRFLRGLPDEPIGPANRVTVYVLDSAGDVARLADMRSVAGFYDSRAGGSVAFVPRSSGDGGRYDLSPQQVLLHEYSHHFMFTNFPDTAYPSWYAEGFAEFHATALFEPDGGVMFGQSPAYRAPGFVLNAPVKLSRLLALDNAGKLTEVEREALYGRGWLLVHYSTFNLARRDQLLAYIKALDAGKPPAEAAAAFGDLAAYDAELNRYLQKPRLPAYRVAPSSLAIGKVTVRALAVGEAAAMPVRIRSKRGVDKTTAPGVLVAARRVAQRFPDDPAVQLTLTEAEYDAGHYPEALTAAEKSLALTPKSTEALIREAMALEALARAGGADAGPRWTAMRSVLLAVNRLDNDDPRALWMFYRMQREQGLKPNDNAKAALYRAYSLAPADWALRFEVAQQAWRDGRRDEAKVALRPIAYAPHYGAMAAAASRIMAAIDSNADIDATLKGDPASGQP